MEGILVWFFLLLLLCVFIQITFNSRTTAVFKYNILRLLNSPAAFFYPIWDTLCFDLRINKRPFTLTWRSFMTFWLCSLRSPNRVVKCIFLRGAPCEMSLQGYVMRSLPRILPNKNKNKRGKKLLGVEIRHFYTGLMCRTVCMGWHWIGQKQIAIRNWNDEWKTKIRRPRRESSAWIHPPPTLCLELCSNSWSNET